MRWRPPQPQAALLPEMGRPADFVPVPDSAGPAGLADLAVPMDLAALAEVICSKSSNECLLSP